MTRLFEQAVERAQSLPAEMQDEIARMVLAYAGDVGDGPDVIQLTPDEEADLAESDAEEACGEFATDEEMRAIWAKHGL